jgi:transcriptional regulator with PAS, ATPase and Fis domain
MGTIRILDLDPAHGLGAELEAILGPAVGDLAVRRVTMTPELGPPPPGDTALTFLVMPAGSAQESGPLLAAIRRASPHAPLLALVGRTDPERTFTLLPPPDPQEPSVARLKEKAGLRHLVGESGSFLSVLEKIPLVARCDASVLVSGETGTGKELVARAVHYLSPRAKKPFIPVNCGAIPTELVENELFGHQRSAYTGAVTAQAGLIEEAEGGTLLLDEVDCLPLLAQVKLLRFLQEREYRSLGSTRLRKADVRVIAAANGDLEQAVAQGRLRQDLYYRLNVIPLRLPSLRERREDIPLLADHFVDKHATRVGRPAPRLAPASLQALVAYDWPGNVRELEHVLERAVVLSQEEAWIRPEHIALPQAEPRDGHEAFQWAKARAVAQFEATYIRGLLLSHQGNITRAAKAAGKNRRAFWELIRKHGIDAGRFRPGSTPDQDNPPPHQDKNVLLRIP